MIHAYGRNGELSKAMETFDKMMDIHGVFPDRKTFISLLDKEDFDVDRIFSSLM